MKKFLLPLLALIFAAGCAHVISDENRNLVDKSISFGKLLSNPEAFVGKYVMVGGTIAGVRNTKEGGEIEVVQSELDSSDRPEDTYGSRGRFLGVTKEFLDPEKFKKGREVTIVGEVKGKLVRQIDEIQYSYPVLDVREIHLWRPEPPPTYQYRDPYFYNYPYYWDPYWSDPWWPHRYYRPGPWRW